MEVPTAPERDSMAEQKEDGGQKENLLIVEDNEELKTLLQHSLEDSYQVRIAEDGEVAWEIIREKCPTSSFQT